ncbi:MAG: hypothetical protein DMF53_08195 [Acidobacteria bacterium]|nr:MAG: hypothetical protein DMF53_08195 [Acidobacteriota bacterium]
MGQPLPNEILVQDLAGQPLPSEISGQDLAGQPLPPEIPEQNLTGQRLPSEILKEDLVGQRLPCEIPEKNLGGQRLPREIPEENLVGRPPPSEIPGGNSGGRRRHSRGAFGPRNFRVPIRHNPCMSQNRMSRRAVQVVAENRIREAIEEGLFVGERLRGDLALGLQVQPVGRGLFRVLQYGPQRREVPGEDGIVGLMNARVGDQSLPVHQGIRKSDLRHIDPFTIQIDAVFPYSTLRTPK